MAIKVHGNPISPAVQRVLAALYEKGLEYEFITLNLGAGDHKKEPFISINPFGQIPGFEDGDLKLFESRAITQYIAHAYAGKGTPLVFQDIKKQAYVFVWSEAETQQFDPSANKLVFELIIKPMLGMTADDAVVEENKEKLVKVLEVYEARLSATKYLAGDSFTLADLHHLPAIQYLSGTKIKAVFDAQPHVSKWAAEILARPSWGKVVATLPK